MDLLCRSNPPLLEWFGSPIIYLESTSITAKIRSVLPIYYSPINCFSHYLHMAEGNLREYLVAKLSAQRNISTFSGRFLRCSGSNVVLALFQRISTSWSIASLKIANYLPISNIFSKKNGLARSFKANPELNPLARLLLSLKSNVFL